MRLNQIARKLNISTKTVVAHLAKQGIEIKDMPNTKVSATQIACLQALFPEAVLKIVKEKTDSTPVKLSDPPLETPSAEVSKPLVTPPAVSKVPPKVQVKKAAIKEATETEVKIKEEPTIEEKVPVEDNSKHPSTSNITSKIATSLKPSILEKFTTKETIKVYTSKAAPASQSRPTPKSSPRKRILKVTSSTSKSTQGTPSSKKSFRPAFSPRKVNILRSSYRKKKKDLQTDTTPLEILRVTAQVTAHEFALLLKVPMKKLLAVCTNLGVVISNNQRLGADLIKLIAEAFEQNIELVHLDTPQTSSETDLPENLVARSPIVTILGHVDHGKTSLLDFLRKTKVVDKEAGGITQHISAYKIQVENKREITLLDTPGHKAFTAMRARGANVTDIAIIIIAADDGVMPQTKEAINHAQSTGTAMIFAFNKIDKPHGSTDRIKQQLAELNIMVEDWGGKYQTQEISAKTGEGIDALLSKILLETDLMELKANPNKAAQGVVIEASIKKGRGNLITAIVQQGTLKNGDIILVGPYFGKVKALETTQGKPLRKAIPATPVQLFGINGIPKAGQTFKVVNSEQSARASALKHHGILQEQKLRARQGDLLERFHRNLRQEQTKALNILLKGDSDGSVDALSDMLLTLNTPELPINIIKQAVGTISESDILLSANAGNALIIGFQTKLDPNARKALEKTPVKIKHCKIIYEAIDFVQAFIAQQQEPEEELLFIGKADVVRIFKITRVGTIAGCIVREGKIKRNAIVHLLRNGEVLYKGPIKQLKREKTAIKEANNGTECGIHATAFEEIQTGDVIECFEIKT